MTAKQDHELEIQVKSLKTNARTHFKLSPSATLDQLWTVASDGDHLDEPRGDGDTLRCKDGADLTEQLGVTLAQLVESGQCPGRQFEIRGPSGGASLYA